MTTQAVGVLTETQREQPVERAAALRWLGARKACVACPRCSAGSESAVKSWKFNLRAYAVIAVVAALAMHFTRGVIVRPCGRICIFNGGAQAVVTGTNADTHWWDLPRDVAIVLAIVGLIHLTYTAWSLKMRPGAGIDSDGDGVPDSVDADPYDPEAQ